MTVTALCASPRCYFDPDTGELTPYEAAPGLRLCWWCRDRLADKLDELPGLYVALEEMLAAATGGTSEKVSGTATRGLPINPAVVEARANIRGVLASWADLVSAERGITAARPVAALAAFLSRSLDWLAAHPSAGDVAEEVGDLIHAGRRAAYPNPVRRITIGPCPVGECAGQLHAVLREAGRGSAIGCTDHHEHTWPADAWFALARQTRKGNSR